MSLVALLTKSVSARMLSRLSNVPFVRKPTKYEYCSSFHALHS